MLNEKEGEEKDRKERRTVVEEDALGWMMRMTGKNGLRRRRLLLDEEKKEADGGNELN